MELTHIVLGLALLASLGTLGFLLVRGSVRGSATREEAESIAAKIIANAEREAEVSRKAVELEVKDERISARRQIEEETRASRKELSDMEHRLASREHSVEEQERKADQQEQDLKALESRLSERESALTRELERVAGLTREEAGEALFERLESEVRFDAARMVQRVEDEAKATADERARHVIASAIQRIASDYVVESTITVINLPSDEMKGRIIGREGRNIRALEAATGVNLIVDETPETILVSCFDPLRREVARMTLERLMADGRFHPTRIEETVTSVEKKLDEEMREEATKVIFDLGVRDLDPELVGLLGRLKYRLSYGQNNLRHAHEVARICGLMASELGLDRNLAVRGGLLHDIGKCLTQDVGGAHAEAGAEFARKCGEHAHVVNAIAAHHGDVPPLTKEAYLVAAGDALSAGRPGARRENMELYIKRLSDLEQVAGSFPGVQKVYAMQAGREIRVLVDADSVSDGECSLISRDIAKRIEEELNYPGQIKVCLVRESRFIEYAR